MTNLSIVDLETTGLDANRNRIIEIGIIRVENGQVVERYSQLVNPECRIPSFIEHHTGISATMIKKAPTFARLLPKVKTLLADGYFVAHNASFDYSFMQAEYKRQGAVYVAPRLCTVRLSRRLFPNFRHHGLDSIISRFGLVCPSRHRALDDAEIVWQFYQMVSQNVTPELLGT